MTGPDLSVQRVRHELKMRLLQVTRIRLISPQLLRVTLSGHDLHGFVSASFDDHIASSYWKRGASAVHETHDD